MPTWGAWIVQEKEVHLVGLPENFSGRVELWEKKNEEKVKLTIQKFFWENGVWVAKVASKLILGHHYQASAFGKVVNAFWPYEYVAKLCPDPGDDLGFSQQKQYWQFKLWSPTAQDVQLLLYATAHGPVVDKIQMKREKNGVWSLRLPWAAYQTRAQRSSRSTITTSNSSSSSSGPLYYYQYQVTALGHCRKVLDPYAKAMAPFDPRGPENVGRAITWAAPWPKVDPTERPGGEGRNLSSLMKAKGKAGKKIKVKIDPAANGENDFIALELHVRDVTIDESSSVPLALKGTFLGLKEVLPYFKALGVTHLQLMPCQKYFTVQENKRGFQGEDVPPEEINYNWGYDAHQFFIPQGQYVVDLNDPAGRSREFRELTKAAHKLGIGIILDVVYNHVFAGRAIEDAAPGLYLRRQANTYVSKGTGAGDSLETRSPLMRKLIIDSLVYWYERLGIDGVRFDLMGFIDHQTMQAIRQRLPDAILYGEAWNFTDLPPAEATTKNNLIAAGAFNDSCRDAILGSVQGRGWLLGNLAAVSSVKAAIIGGLQNYLPPYGEVAEDDYQRFAIYPQQTMNFLTIHDGFTLWDKINLSVGGDRAYKERLMRQAFLMLLTCQGRIVLQGGDEIARTKPRGNNDPTPERSVTSNEAIDFFSHRYFHENSYHSPDFTNRWDWARGKDFAQLHDYVQQLIHLRRACPAFAYPDAKTMQQKLHFLGRPENQVLDLPGDHARYKSWKEVALLELVFINVPADWRNKTLYLAGGVHPRDPNPRTPIAVHFDGQGRGRVKFAKSQVEKFNFGIWGNRDQLQFKLVVAPGSWQTPYPLYQDNGCHNLACGDILKGDVAVIDLSLSHHHSPGTIVYYPQDLIAFSLDNRSNAGSSFPYENLLVIHYAGDNDSEFLLPAGNKRWQILADSASGAIWPKGKDWAAQIKAGKIILPGHSSVILGQMGPGESSQKAKIKKQSEKKNEKGKRK